MKKLIISIIIAGFLLLPTSAHALKAFAFIRMAGGSPQIDQTTTPYYGFAYVGRIGVWGAYIISGTQAQLLALNALPEVVGVCFVSQADTERWPELNDTINPAVRTKINTFLINRGFEFTIPVEWTNRQVLLKTFKYFNYNYTLNGTDICEPEE